MPFETQVSSLFVFLVWYPSQHPHGFPNQMSFEIRTVLVDLGLFKVKDDFRSFTQFIPHISWKQAIIKTKKIQSELKQSLEWPPLLSVWQPPAAPLSRWSVSNICALAVVSLLTRECILHTTLSIVYLHSFNIYFSEKGMSQHDMTVKE